MSFRDEAGSILVDFIVKIRKGATKDIAVQTLDALTALHEREQTEAYDAGVIAEQNTILRFAKNRDDVNRGFNVFVPDEYFQRRRANREVESNDKHRI